MNKPTIISDNNKIFYNPFTNMEFRYKNCFLCGTKLDDEKKSEEHVYPKWLQREFQLYNKELIILNSKPIKYSKLKVPCCKECNNFLGDTLEKQLKEAYSKGYENFIKLDKFTVFHWLNKISYGTVYKELSLKINQSNPKSSKIISSDELRERHYTQYMMLLSLKFNTNYVNKPFSIFIFKIKGENDFWVFDSPHTKVICMILNNIGIIASLQDSGYLYSILRNDNKWKIAAINELHPIQFRELCAEFVYKRVLMSKDTSYSYLYQDDGRQMTIISNHFKDDILKNNDIELYLYYLDLFISPFGLKKSALFKDNRVITFLYDKKGAFRNIKTHDES